MRKLEDEDPPLMNVLFWGPNNTEKSMELRENETGIVQVRIKTEPRQNIPPGGPEGFISKHM